MALYVSHRTAMRMYRFGVVSVDDRRRVRVRPKLQDRQSLKAFSRMAFRSASQCANAMAHPVDVVVSNADARVRSKAVRSHVAGHSFPEGSFLHPVEGLYLASPELVFLQMARYLDRIDLAVLGYELCGSYRMHADSSSFDVAVLDNAFDMELIGDKDAPSLDRGQTDGFVNGFRPLTSVARLGRYLDRAEGAPGALRARWVLSHVLDNSASPMESLLALRLVLPHSAGGYGLPHPEMNGKVAVSQKASSRYGQRHRLCDLLWRKEGVAVEYDSDAYHASGQKIADDSARRSELLHAGISVTTVTTRLFYDYASFDAQAHVIEKLLKRRDRSRLKDLDRRRRALHYRLTKDCAALRDDLSSERMGGL